MGTADLTIPPIPIRLATQRVVLARCLLPDSGLEVLQRLFNICHRLFHGWLAVPASCQASGAGARATRPRVPRKFLSQMATEDDDDGDDDDMTMMTTTTMTTTMTTMITTMTTMMTTMMTTITTITTMETTMTTTMTTMTTTMTMISCMQNASLQQLETVAMPDGASDSRQSSSLFWNVFWTGKRR